MIISPANSLKKTGFGSSFFLSKKLFYKFLENYVNLVDNMPLWVYNIITIKGTGVRTKGVKNVKSRLL